MPTWNPIKRQREKEAEVRRQREEDRHAQLHEYMRLQAEITERDELIRQQQAAREEERERANQFLRHQVEQHRIKLQAEQDTNERRRRAELQARALEERRVQEEAARQLAEERRKNSLLQREKMEKEAREAEALRREQLAQSIARAREEKRVQAQRRTTPDAIRSLRGIVRRKYELDMMIWANRRVRAPLRPDIQVKMEQADAAYLEILTIVRGWEDIGVGKGGWQPHEWELVKEVVERLEADGEKRWWEDNPPWEED